MRNMRPTKDEYYLSIASVVASRSTCVRHKYGAIIVKDDNIVGTGYNGAPRGEKNCCDVGQCYSLLGIKPLKTKNVHYGNCVAVHAEVNAIIGVSRENLQGAVLYLTCLDKLAEPCNYCDRLLRNTGISKIVTNYEVITFAAD